MRTQLRENTGHTYDSSTFIRCEIGYTIISLGHEVIKFPRFLIRLTPPIVCTKNVANNASPVEAFLFLGMFLIDVEGSMSELEVLTIWRVSADSLYELRRPSDCVFHLEGNPDWRGLPIAMYVYSYRTQSWRRRRGFFSPLRENFLKLVSYDSRNLCARFFTLAVHIELEGHSLKPRCFNAL